MTLPETLPVTESLELTKGLKKHRLPVAGVIVNRVPADPFSADERAAVGAVLAQGGQVLGQREMQRIARAKTAIALLQDHQVESFITVPELEATGAHLSRLLATLLWPDPSPPPASR